MKLEATNTAVQPGVHRDHGRESVKPDPPAQATSTPPHAQGEAARCATESGTSPLSHLAKVLSMGTRTAV